LPTRKTSLNCTDWTRRFVALPCTSESMHSYQQSPEHRPRHQPDLDVDRSDADDRGEVTRRNQGRLFSYCSISNRHTFRNRRFNVFRSQILCTPNTQRLRRFPCLCHRRHDSSRSSRTPEEQRNTGTHVRFVITDVVRTMGDHHSLTFVHASSVILDVKSWKHCRRRENAIEPAVIFLRTWLQQLVCSCHVALHFLFVTQIRSVVPFLLSHARNNQIDRSVHGFC
jgi:hypothetical protein